MSYQGVFIGALKCILVDLWVWHDTIQFVHEKIGYDE